MCDVEQERGSKAMITRGEGRVKGKVREGKG